MGLFVDILRCGRTYPKINGSPLVCLFQDLLSFLSFANFSRIEWVHT